MPASRVFLREVVGSRRPPSQFATDRGCLADSSSPAMGRRSPNSSAATARWFLGLCRASRPMLAPTPTTPFRPRPRPRSQGPRRWRPDRLGAWLFGVAWRTANKLRARRRSLVPLPDDLADRPTAPADWPVELDAAIARLPDKYRAPVVLCHLQGLTPAEAAERLGCPPSTVATRLSRARDTLRKRLAVRGLAVPAGLVAGAALHLPPALTAAVAGMAAGHSTPTPAARLAAEAYWSFSMAQFRVLAASALIVVLTGVGLYGSRAGGQVPTVPSVEQPLPRVPEAPTLPPPALPATVTTDNFTVTGPSARIARLIADAAERARKDVAIAWLGKELRRDSRTRSGDVRAEYLARPVRRFAAGGFRGSDRRGQLDRVLPTRSRTR